MGKKGSSFADKRTASADEVLAYGRKHGCVEQHRGNHRGLYNSEHDEFLAVGNHRGDLSPGVFGTVRKVFGRWGILLFPLLCIGSFWLLLYAAAQ